MSTRFHLPRRRTLMLGLVSATLLATTAWPGAGHTQEQRLRPHNNGRGIHRPVRTPQERAETEAVRLSGVFRHSLRKGLTLSDRAVVVSGGTAVFPSLRGKSYLPDPEDLRGRSATVYGKQGPNGVEAVLVILDVNERYGVELPTPESAAMSLGDGAEEPVELPEGTPQ